MNKKLEGGVAVKKVGLLISTLNSGGAERVVSHLSNILKKGYDVHLILFEDTYIEYQYGGVLHNLDVPTKSGSVFKKLSLLRQRIKRLKRVIKENELDCVISFLDSPNFVNLFAKVKGCKKIISIRNYSGIENSTSRLGRLTDKIMKRLYKKADHVVTVSKLIEQDFKKYYNISEDKISTIYNPYNFSEIDEKATEPLSDSEALFYKDKFVFCNVGRIMYQKGVWHLLKAFASVKKEMPHAALVIVGENLSCGKPEKLVEELGITDSVLFTGRTKNPYKYMKNSDCYVLSSLFEGFPNAMVEAMACGCPIIAADCKSGPREILCDNPSLDLIAENVEMSDYGIIVPPLEPEELWDATVTAHEWQLADAMKMIAVDSELRRKMASLAKNRSLEYNFDTCYRRFEKIVG